MSFHDANLRYNPQEMTQVTQMTQVWDYAWSPRSTASTMARIPAFMTTGSLGQATSNRARSAFAGNVPESVSGRLLGTVVGTTPAWPLPNV